MSLKFVTKKMEVQSLLEDERFSERDDEDSGTESDDERGDEDEESSPGGAFALPGFQSRTSSRSPSFRGRAKEDVRCDVEDNYSSEEELKEIICEKNNHPAFPTSSSAEKRKWSEIEGSESESEGQSPEFIVDGPKNGLSTPVQFRTSPPLDVHRPRQSQSPQPKLFDPSSSNEAKSSQTNNADTENRDHDLRRYSKESPFSSSSSSKRHRLTARPHNIQRPCLDFEKMQQIKRRVVTSWRPKGTELSLFCW